MSSENEFTTFSSRTLINHQTDTPPDFIYPHTDLFKQILTNSFTKLKHFESMLWKSHATTKTILAAFSRASSTSSIFIIQKQH